MFQSRTAEKTFSLRSIYFHVGIAKTTLRNGLAGRERIGAFTPYPDEGKPCKIRCGVTDIVVYNLQLVQSWKRAMEVPGLCRDM